MSDGALYLYHLRREEERARMTTERTNRADRLRGEIVRTVDDAFARARASRMKHRTFLPAPVMD